MCVIINKPPNVVIDENTLRLCWDRNPHGAGFMWVEDGKLQTQKGYMSYDTFLGAYKLINPLEKNVLIHFRLASSGMIIPEQTHPFMVNENLAVMHNGHVESEMVNRELDKDEKNSDTYICMEKILKKLPKNFLEYDGIIELLKEYVLGSILVFMDSTGKVTPVTECVAGYTEGGCWFSNDHWKFPTECDDEDNDTGDIKWSSYGNNWDYEGEFGDDEGLMDKVLNGGNKPCV